MENNVIISIQGKQSFEAQGDDTIELVTEGCLEPDGDDGYTLSYQESELTGLEGTLTTFQIERDRVTLLRVGEVNSQMVFEEGRRHLSMYDTPIRRPVRRHQHPQDAGRVGRQGRQHRDRLRHRN